MNIDPIINKIKLESLYAEFLEKSTFVDSLKMIGYKFIHKDDICILTNLSDWFPIKHLLLFDGDEDNSNRYLVPIYKNRLYIDAYFEFQVLNNKDIWTCKYVGNNEFLPPEYWKENEEIIGKLIEFKVDKDFDCSNISIAQSSDFNIYKEKNLKNIHLYV